MWNDVAFFPPRGRQSARPPILAHGTHGRGQETSARCLKGCSCLLLGRGMSPINSGCEFVLALANLGVLALETRVDQSVDPVIGTGDLARDLEGDAEDAVPNGRVKVVG